MINDLNMLILFSNHDVFLKESRQRKYLTIIDGIIGGEGNGPLEPTPVESGLIIAGFDPLVTDLVTTKLIGFESNKIPKFKNYKKK